MCKRNESEVRLWKFWPGACNTGAGSGFILSLAQIISLLAVTLAEFLTGSYLKVELISVTSNLSKLGTGSMTVGSRADREPT